MSNTKNVLHPRNKHNKNYDFTALIKASPALSPFVADNKYGNASIDFADPLAVKTLNCAILKHQYSIEHWDIPDGFLCPPIPGRVDYIHYLSDLLTQSNQGKRVNGARVTGLDIGTGASCIYPLLGQRAYAWQFVASDIDPKSIVSSQLIIDSNKGLSKSIRLHLQKNANKTFDGIIGVNDYFDFTMCNPPFHQSLSEANAGSQRKRKNLGIENKSALNFGGQKAELWCDGGELTFISNMIKQSKQYAHQVLWFTSLVSKSANLSPLKKQLRQAQVYDIKVVEMAQGQKVSRFIAWTYLTKPQQDGWCKIRYK